MSHGLERLDALQSSLAELAEAVAALVREEDRPAAEEHLALAQTHPAHAGELKQTEAH
jgi:hypothetical protein